LGPACNGGVVELSYEVTASGDLGPSPPWSFPPHRDQHPRETSRVGIIPGKGSKPHNPCKDGPPRQRQDPGSFELSPQLSLAGGCQRSHLRDADLPLLLAEQIGDRGHLLQAEASEACDFARKNPGTKPCTGPMHRWVCAPGAPTSPCTPADRAPRIYPYTPEQAPQHLGSPHPGMHRGTADLPVHPCMCKRHRGSPCAPLCV